MRQPPVDTWGSSSSIAEWYAYVVQAAGGAFLTNAIPHFVHGVSGSRFQSPFGKPLGVGESSPVSNVVWGFGNMAVGGFLLTQFPPSSLVSRGVVGAAIFLSGLLLARYFGRIRGG